MKRRDFLLAALGSLIAGATKAGTQEIAINRRSCRTLEGLQDYVTGAAFRYPENMFLLAYFSTPHKLYDRCDTDAINMAQAIAMADLEDRILPVLVFTPPEPGKSPDFAQTYTAGQSGSIKFIGLTGGKDQVTAIAREHRAAYQVDHKTGLVKSHNRSTILISPNAEILNKFLPEDNPVLMAQRLDNAVRAYHSRNIAPAKGCDHG